MVLMLGIAQTKQAIHAPVAEALREIIKAQSLAGIPSFVTLDVIEDVVAEIYEED